MKPISIKHASDDLALAIIAGRVVSEYDEPDPELLGSSVEEEEEEEEGAEDRGDDVDPDLLPEEDEDLELEEDDQDDDQGGGEQDVDQGGDDQDDELDEDALAKIAGTGKSATVPHARFNEVNESLKEERKRRLELEEELARARGSVPAKKEEDPPKSFDYDEAEDRYNQAILEGDADAAKAIRREIRAAERKEIEEAAQQRAEALYQQRAQEAAQRQQQAALPAVLKESYEKFPFLDYQGSAPNMDAIEDVIALRDHYIAKGEPMAKALARAVAKVGPRYAEPVSVDKAPKKGVTLTTEQIERNLNRERATPPLTPGVGERGAAFDVANMSEDDYAKLSAEEKKRLRGDFISR